MCEFLAQYKAASSFRLFHRLSLIPNLQNLDQDDFQEAWTCGDLSFLVRSSSERHFMINVWQTYGFWNYPKSLHALTHLPILIGPTKVIITLLSF